MQIFLNEHNETFWVSIWHARHSWVQLTLHGRVLFMLVLGCQSSTVHNFFSSIFAHFYSKFQACNAKMLRSPYSWFIVWWNMRLSLKSTHRVVTWLFCQLISKVSNLTSTSCNIKLWISIAFVLSAIHLLSEESNLGCYLLGLVGAEMSEDKLHALLNAQE